MVVMPDDPDDAKLATEVRTGHTSLDYVTLRQRKKAAISSLLYTCSYKKEDPLSIVSLGAVCETIPPSGRRPSSSEAILELNSPSAQPDSCPIHQNDHPKDASGSTSFQLKSVYAVNASEEFPNLLKHKSNSAFDSGN
jgi:hypothetical protein